jgi:dimethylargininase
MRVFDFTHAIVRTPGRSVVHGLRKGPEAPTYEGVLAEHAAYVTALREAGLAIDVLPPLEAFPDAVFVEDPALVLPEGAIVLRPGVASRMGEADEIRGAIDRHFDRVLALEGEEYADGGDVLVTQDEIFIGLSRRTNRKGAEALAGKLATLGRKARIAQTPADILHFKTASSLLDEGTVLATEQMAASGNFAGFRIVVVPTGEEGAANFLRVNNVILVGAHFPRTIALLGSLGYETRPMPVREIAKLDAGLSCMSLRWHGK